MMRLINCSRAHRRSGSECCEGIMERMCNFELLWRYIQHLQIDAIESGTDSDMIDASNVLDVIYVICERERKKVEL